MRDGLRQTADSSSRFLGPFRRGLGRAMVCLLLVSVVTGCSSLPGSQAGSPTATQAAGAQTGREGQAALLAGDSAAIPTPAAGEKPAATATAAATPTATATATAAATATATPMPPTPTPETLSAAVPAPKLRLAAFADTGVSRSDNLTGNNAPTVVGEAPAGSKVHVYNEGVLTGTASVDGQGHWGFALDVSDGLPDGVYTISARTVNAAGQVSAQAATIRITINTNPPAMPVLTLPAAGSHVASGPVIFAGSAPPHTTVTVLDRRQPIGAAVVSAQGAWRVAIAGIQPGVHTFRARATDAAGNISPAFNDDVVTVDAAAGAAPAVPAATGIATGAVVAMAAGDIACDASSSPEGRGGTNANCQQMATAKILAEQQPDVVMALGDNAYECSSLSDYENYYGPSWGQLKAQTRPAIGNHEYQTSTDPADPCYNAPSGAPGYFTYFGSAAHPDQPDCTVKCKGYYSYDMGAWHIVVLNSICTWVGGCGLGSAEETWLKKDLETHPATCTLAYWHYPRFTSGQSGAQFVNELKAMWQDLYNAGVDIVLNGHDHDYERFAPMDLNGNLDPAHGIREFVVGTGGRSHQPFSQIAPHSEVRNSDTFGVLKLTLGPSSYSWQFLAADGQHFSDSGGPEDCHSW